MLVVVAYLAAQDEPDSAVRKNWTHPETGQDLVEERRRTATAKSAISTPQEGKQTSISLGAGSTASS